MKRIACLLMLMALSSPASARDSYSFNVRGHHVYIPRNCRSMSCVSIDGVDKWRKGRRVEDSDDVASVKDPAPAAPPPAAPAVVPPPAQPAAGPTVVQVPPAPAAAPPVQTATRAETITAPGQAQPAPVRPAPPPVQAQTAPSTAPTLAAAPATRIVPLNGTGFEVPKVSSTPDTSATKTIEKSQNKPQEKSVVEQPAPRVNPQVARAVPLDEDVAADSPVGDWQTEGKSVLVRIEACGPSLCGYALNASTRLKGETVLVNMRPKKSQQWSGMVYSRHSGNGYYGTMTQKDGDTLRVEACAIGSYFCSGNNWTRIDQSRSVRPEQIVTPRQEARN